MIIIKREPAYGDKLRNYKVILDSAAIGEVADGQSEAFDVEPGEHTLYLKVDWATSNKVSFQSVADKDIHFHCGNRLKDGKAWFAIFYLLFMPHKYIELERSSQE